jgi:hypothetical protein
LAGRVVVHDDEFWQIRLDSGDDGIDVRRFVEAWNHRSAWAFPIHHILKNMRAFAVNPRCQDAGRF